MTTLGISFPLKLGRPASRVQIAGTLLPITACILFPLTVLATSTSLVHQAGCLDPYIYASYAYDFQQIIDRFGQTYYSTRIAYIFLERAFADLFGVENGYVICRFVALSSSATAAYMIALRYYGHATAVFAAAWISFLPWLLRSLLWTHYDGFGTAYLLIALAFVLVPRRHTLVWHIAAGMAYALATNCNLLLLALGGAFFPAWLVLNVHRRSGWLAARVFAIVVGFLITHGALSVTYQMHFATSGISMEYATFQITRSLLTGLGANWFAPLGKILDVGIYIPLIPLVLAPAICVYWWRNCRNDGSDRQKFFLAAILYLALVIAVFWILHGVFKIAVLSRIYYLVYLLPACLLGLIALAGEWECATVSEKRWQLYVLPLALILFWFARPELPAVAAFESSGLWLGLGVATIAVAVMGSGRRHAALTLTCACAMTLAVYASYSGKYHIHRSRADAAAAKFAAKELDVFRGAIFLQKYVGSRVPLRRSVGFWYGNTPAHSALNSVQSMYLWGFTRLAPPKGIDLGMPHIDRGIRTAIASKSVVALLGLNESEIDRGISALAAAGIPHREFTRTTFEGKTWGYTIALVDILEVPAQEDAATELAPGSQ